jgi:hypothetical protein
MARDVDALFRTPLADFTAARNALAAQLKKSGHDEDAAAIKALPKPSISAWAVNQLYWQHRAAFDRLIEAGERFRKAQAAQLAGKQADVRGPLDARREALGRLASLAAGILDAGGHSSTPDMMRRVTSTLEAIATYGKSEQAPPAGRLIDDVEPPGFETLAALVPRIGGGDRAGTPPRVLPFEHHHRRASRKKATAEEDRRRLEAERREARTNATRALREAERALAQAKKTAEKLETALKAAAARVKETERERAAAQKTFDRIAGAADAAKQEARRIAGDAENAAQAIEDAEREIDRATRQLESLE